MPMYLLLAYTLRLDARTCTRCVPTCAMRRCATGRHLMLCFDWSRVLAATATCEDYSTASTADCQARLAHSAWMVYCRYRAPTPLILDSKRDWLSHRVDRRPSTVYWYRSYDRLSRPSAA